MSKENLKTIIFVHSPQNSKTPDLPQTDLLENLSFRSVVDAFDLAWGTEKGGSLRFGRQGASAVNSIGVLDAFSEGLRREICPGLITPNFPIKYVITAHSLIEIGSWVGSGVLNIPTAAETLTARQEITEKPVSAGTRYAKKYMVAVLGFDVSKSQSALEKINSESRGEEEAVIANFNTPTEAVFSIQVNNKEEDEERNLADRIAGFLGEFKDRSANKLRAIKLPVPTAFHSRFLEAEELLFIDAVGPMIRRQIQDIPPRTIYSPMLPGWIENRDQAIDVILHQLTRQVNFVKAMKDLTDGSLDILAIITADVTNITTRMVTNNLGAVKFPVLNIKNMQDLDEAIAICAKQYRLG